MSSITRQYARYSYSDEALGLEITLKQLHIKHFEGGAHVTIWATAPDGEKHRLYRGRSPITTTAARQKIASGVEKRIRGDERNGDMGMQGIFGVNSPLVRNDWESTIIDAMEGILEAHYRGDPPINLFDDDDDEEETWRIPGLLSEDINVIYGKPGSGKSYLAIIFGQAINRGIPVCGLETTQGNVLLIDYETTKAKMRRRFYRVNAGLGLEGRPIHYMPATVPVTQLIEALQEYITEFNIRFVIIDSLARASGGSITDEEGVGLFFEAVRQLERACLIIHHTNRSDDYFGSSYILANARNMWRLNSVPSEGQGKLSIQLNQEKENDGPSMGSLGFVLKFEGDPFDPDAVILSPQDPSVIPELRKHIRLWQQIEAYLRETPFHRMPVGEVAESLGLDKPRQETLRNYLWALKNDTHKYKKLEQIMHVNDGWLRLNTQTGLEEQSVELPETNTETETQSTPVVSSVSHVSLNSTTGDLGWGVMNVSDVSDTPVVEDEPRRRIVI